MTEDKISGWHHRLNRHEFEQGPGILVMDRKTWYAAVHEVRKESDMTELLK